MSVVEMIRPEEVDTEIKSAGMINASLALLIPRH